MNKLLAALAVALVLVPASGALAQTPGVAAEVSSSRLERPFSLAGVTTFLNGSYPMVGVAGQYQLADRVSVGVQLTLGVLVIDAGLGGRYFLIAEPKSGLYVDLSAHAVGGPMIRGQGGVAEVGYQYRARSGFLVEAGVGAAVLHVPGDCGCRPRDIESDPWWTLGQVTLRFGYAF